MAVFKATGMGNELLECGDYFVSFSDGSGRGNPFFNVGSFASDDPVRGETALCHRSIDNGKRKYFILNGDWRAEYRRLSAEGWDACLAFYQSKRAEYRSSWSEDADDEPVTDNAVAGNQA